MDKCTIREVEAAVRIASLQDKPKDRGFSGKKDKKHLPQEKKKESFSHDFVGELKTQLTYGDTGHGILLDKKV